MFPGVKVQISDTVWKRLNSTKLMFKPVNATLLNLQQVILPLYYISKRPHCLKSKFELNIIPLLSIFLRHCQSAKVIWSASKLACWFQCLVYYILYLSVLYLPILFLDITLPFNVKTCTYSHTCKKILYLLGFMSWVCHHKPLSLVSLCP